MGAKPDQLVHRLLDRAGTTYAEEAGVHLKDTPMPLFQLLTLCMLASKPIDATIAMRAGHELFAAGIRTPDTVLEAKRQKMIDAFAHAGYARYDESSATRLTDMATAVRDGYSGDLRNLAESAGHDVAAAKKLLMEFKGIGDTGADIFLREVQDTWTWVRPHFDERARGAAKELGLPTDAARLGELASGRNAALAAALVRVSLDDALRDEIAG
ncbi:HhH-GDP family DNA glycosylase [Mycolicibacterium arseniciresistens]|nr:endonuclease [Mycolicibacterium arseniciresistens]MDO3635961.1 endonuclease [Mycolicibacterium arseniciresistens]